MIEPETIHLCYLCNHGSTIEIHLVSMVMLCIHIYMQQPVDQTPMFVGETAVKNVSCFFCNVPCWVLSVIVHPRWWFCFLRCTLTLLLAG